MGKYRKRPEIIEAFLWRPGTMPEIIISCSSSGVCGSCGGKMDLHGELDGVLVCPGDMVANIIGKWKVYKSRDFAKKYDYVGE